MRPQRHIVSALLATLAFSACSAAEAATTSEVAVVLGARSNSPGITAADLDEALDLLREEGDRIVVVVAEGEPTVAIDYTLNRLRDYAEDREKDLENHRDRLLTSMRTLGAQTSEADLTEAIARAADSFSPGAEHTMVILDSGVQTIGALDLREGRLYHEPAELIDAVADSGTLPDLEGVTVRMPRLGVVVPPQDPLVTDARASLTAIWTEYFSATGATDVTLGTGNVVPTPQDTDLPPVTPIPVTRPEPVPVRECRMLLEEGSVSFAPESAELKDVDQVRQMLEEVHQSLGGCVGPYVIEGSTATWGTPKDAADFSLQRATNVAEVLVAVSGVALGDMTLIGWGHDWPCRVEDVDSNGELDREIAVNNRVVVISKGEASC